MEKYSKVISTDCYVKDKGKVLMLHRNKRESLANKKHYRGVGGKVERGESPIECVKREVKEEAGIDINPTWKGNVTFSRPTGDDWEAHIFTAEGFYGELIDSPEGNLSWISQSEVLNLNMPEGDKILFPILFQDGKFHAHVIYDDYKNLISVKIDKI